MKFRGIYAVIGFTVLCFLVSSSSIAGDDKKSSPENAAITWLKFVDDGKYGESWETAAVYFKNAIAKEKWEQMLMAVRKPLDRMLSRELISRTYKKSLPGAPDGEYMVVQFVTSFTNKKSGIETVTPMLDPDGSWRVSGYYIK